MTTRPYVCMVPTHRPDADVIGIVAPGMDTPLHRLPGESVPQLLYRLRMAMRGDGIVVVTPLLREG